MSEQKAAAVSALSDTKPASPEQIRQLKWSASKSSGQRLASTPKKLDAAVAKLHTVLTAGERAAAEVEAEARSVCISPRTSSSPTPRRHFPVRRLRPIGQIHDRSARDRWDAKQRGEYGWRYMQGVRRYSLYFFAQAQAMSSASWRRDP
jgi:hypothetical protein